MADIFKSRRQTVEKHIIEGEQRDDEPEVKDTRPGGVKDTRSGGATDSRVSSVLQKKDSNSPPRMLESQATSSAQKPATSVTSITVTSLQRSDAGQGQKSQLHRSETIATTGGKENIRPILKKAKTLDPG